jgi:hypothetical protein
MLTHGKREWEENDEENEDTDGEEKGDMRVIFTSSYERYKREQPFLPMSRMSTKQNYSCRRGRLSFVGTLFGYIL